LFCDFLFRFLRILFEHVRFRAIYLLAPQLRRQQTVDDARGALEIRVRSTYVRVHPLASDPRYPEDARLNAARSTRLEMPIWMK
jgi:hypothetical protein